ncbi:hypothetical protein GGS20DRAFT_585154 [Poronia punctata]|nr:hypothetical protein GGS20DRAFT_585154 [Poronia punctata]
MISHFSKKMRCIGIKFGRVIAKAIVVPVLSVPAGAYLSPFMEIDVEVTPKGHGKRNCTIMESAGDPVVQQFPFARKIAKPASNRSRSSSVDTEKSPQFDPISQITTRLASLSISDDEAPLLEPISIASCDYRALGGSVAMMKRFQKDRASRRFRGTVAAIKSGLLDLTERTSWKKHAAKVRKPMLILSFESTVLGMTLNCLSVPSSSLPPPPPPPPQFEPVTFELVTTSKSSLLGSGSASNLLLPQPLPDRT